LTLLAALLLAVLCCTNAGQARTWKKKTVAVEPPPSHVDCQDLSDECGGWRENILRANQANGVTGLGNDQGYMETNCPKTIGLCGDEPTEPSCMDLSEDCQLWKANILRSNAAKGRSGLGSDTGYMTRTCPATIGVCDGAKVLNAGEPDECRDLSADCTDWEENILKANAEKGIEGLGPDMGFMVLNCPATIDQCHNMDLLAEATGLPAPDADL